MEQEEGNTFIPFFLPILLLSVSICVVRCHELEKPPFKTNGWLHTHMKKKEILQPISFASIADPDLLPHIWGEWFTIQVCINKEMQKITTLHTSDFIHPFSSSSTLMGWDSYLDKQNLLDEQTDANFLPVGDDKMTTSMTDVARKF